MLSEISRINRTTDRIRGSSFGAAAVLGVLLAGVAHADTSPTPDPEVARMNAEAARLAAETALLNAQTANSAARFGAPATGLEGTITNPDKFSAMAHWTLSAATNSAVENLSTPIVSKLSSCGSNEVFVTSTEDRRGATFTAEILDNRLVAFTKQLEAALPDGVAPSGKERMAFLAQAAAVRGLVGTVDSLIGLFRTNYTFSDLASTANDVSLRIALARELMTKLGGRRVVVDGLASPAATSGLMATYDGFDTERQRAQNRYAKAFAAAKTDAERAALAGVKALLDGAAALDSALTTPANGQVPLVGIAIAVPIVDSKACVVYARYGSYSASLVTRKRLMSKNDSVVAIAGGTVNYAVFDSTGVMIAADTLAVDERIGGELSDIVDSAKPLGPDSSNRDRSQQKPGGG